MKYTPMDREAVRRDSGKRAVAVTAIRRFFNDASRELPIFDPDDRGAELPDGIDLSEDARNALSDRDWIEGYEAGLDDARREAQGRALLGPGPTQSAYDGWSTGPNRRAAYDAGRTDGATP